MSRRNPDQRRAAREPRGAHRKRRAAGALRRARRAGAASSAISTRAACSACCPACRRLHRRRPRAHRVPARRRHRLPASRKTRWSALPTVDDIRRLVNEGDDILVQVVKDPMGTKGARLTTFVALPSRFMVYMPRGEGIGVSARIEDEAERARLKALVTEAHARGRTHGGYIVRTAAQGVIGRADLARTSSTSAACGSTCARARLARRGRASSCTKTCRCPRACCATNWRAASTACWSINARRTRACWSSPPASCPAAPPASSCTPASGRSSICTASKRRSARRSSASVKLKSGGHLVIDQTESMTTIDVNTGGFVGTAISRTRSSAPTSRRRVAIARQLRLRNLGGIIIIDFIDMTGRSAPHARCWTRCSARWRAITRRPTSPASRRSAWWR